MSRGRRLPYELLCHLQVDAAREAQRRAAAAFQMQQAGEAAMREAVQNASYHDNGPRLEYFDQFETSHR